MSIINSGMTSNDRKLKDYLPMKNSYLVKHYDETSLLIFQDAMDRGYGELFVVHKYTTNLGTNTYKVLVVR